MRRTLAGLLIVTAALVPAGCVGQTDPATNVTATSATLNAHGYTDDGPARWWWEYSANRTTLENGFAPEVCDQSGDGVADFGRCGPAQGGSAQNQIPLSVKVKGLAPGTTYHFRACGQDVNDTGQSCAGIQSFQTLPCPPPPLSLPYGEPTPCSIDAAGETDEFRFSGAAGDRVRVRLIKTGGGNAGFDPSAEVVRPNGTTLSSPTTSDELTVTLDATGTHTILVEDNAGTNTGAYRIAIQRLNNPVDCAAPKLSFGISTRSGSIGAVGETDCFRFDGVAGDRVRVRLIKTGGDAAFDPTAEVVRPDGTTLRTRTTTDAFAVTIGAGGAHTILVEDNAGTSTGGYGISVQRLNDPVGCTVPNLSYGTSPRVEVVGVTGETDCLRFDGAAGDQVRVRLLPTFGTGFDPTAEVLRPDGATRGARTTSDEFTVTLTHTGTHTILVEDSDGRDPGEYVISIQRLNDPVGCAVPSLSYGAAPVAGAIAAAGETDCFRFDGASGDRARTRQVKTGGVLAFLPTQEVVRPNGTTVGARTPGWATVTLDAGGTHTILVEDWIGPNTGSHVISIQRLNNPVGCATPNLSFGAAPTAGAIGAAGETDCLRFSGTAGNQVRVRLLKTSGTAFNPAAETLRPNGTTVGARTTSDEFTVTLDASGTHTILVEDNAGAGTGGYEISIALV